METKQHPDNFMLIIINKHVCNVIPYNDDTPINDYIDTIKSIISEKDELSFIHVTENYIRSLFLDRIDEDEYLRKNTIDSVNEKHSIDGFKH